MKKIFFIITSIFFVANIFAQENKLYNPSANAEKDMTAVVKEARSLHKNILVMAGGNWCSWCVEFTRFTKSDPEIDSVINSAYIWYHLNYSKENKNAEIMARYGFPQRFGFPVFIILNENGERIHTQTSEYLEDGKKSYHKKRVQDFLEMWSPQALDANMYREN